MKSNVEYLNETVWARVKPSPLGGVGVFTIRDMPAGTTITDFMTCKPGLLFITEWEAKELHPAIKSLILDQFLQNREGEIITPPPNSVINLRCFMNHSRTPNTDGMITLCDVPAGVELTEDYTAFGELSSISKEHFGGIL